MEFEKSLDGSFSFVLNVNLSCWPTTNRQPDCDPRGRPRAGGTILEPFGRLTTGSRTLLDKSILLPYLRRCVIYTRLESAAVPNENINDTPRISLLVDPPSTYEG